MKWTLLLFIFSLNTSSGQNCKCTGGSFVKATGQADEIFSIGIHKVGIGKTSSEKDKSFGEIISGLTVFECNTSNVLQEWGEIHSCIISKKTDTLIVSELWALPIGKNYTYVTEPFYITKFFCRENKVVELYYYNQDLPKYTAAQILEVISKSKQLPRQNSDEVIHGADMLLWAFISGSNEAGELLKKYQTTHGPFEGHFSGAIAEEWDNIWTIYTDYMHPKKPEKIK